jgi:YHS domain-containing protein
MRATSLRNLPARRNDDDTLRAPDGLEEELDQPLPPIRPEPAEAAPRGKRVPHQTLKPVPHESDEAPPSAPAAGDSPTSTPNASPASTTPRTGLMGYCPVTLKEAREMAVASAEFRSQFAGKTYEFVSEEAKRQFDANPRLYVPAMNGNDVVLLSKGQRGIEGSLEHAAWYRGKLYLFSSEATRNEFAAGPSKFVAYP